MDRNVNIYIDSSNLIIELAKFADLRLRADTPTKELVDLVWKTVMWSDHQYFEKIDRTYWFGSHHCSTEEAVKYKILIREAEFEPVLLKRAKGKGEKGVDIALATELMTNAFSGRCSHSVIVAGDEDYAPVVREVRRMGHRVDMMFLPDPCSDILRLECDRFVNLICGNGLNQAIGEFKRDTKPAEQDAAPQIRPR